MKLHHIPNIITFFRLMLLGPCIYGLLNEQYVTAFYLFFLAGLSDGLDGWVARRYQWQSQLGGFLDPLSDKLFVSLSYITLGHLGQVPWWLVFIVLFRDVFIVSAVAAWQYMFGHVEFNPTFLSKTNTVLQGLVIFIAIFQLAFHPVATWLFQGLIATITITTLATLVQYSYLAYLAYQEKKRLKKSSHHAVSLRH